MLEKILEIINHILLKNSKPLIKELNLKSNLRNDIGLDSLDLAELTVRIENEYGIDIFENGIIETVEEIINKLDKK